MRIFQITGIYCLKKVNDSAVIFLNRDYKPIGADRQRSGYVDYEKQPSTFELPMPWEQLAKLLDYQIDHGTADLIYLYDGTNEPIRSDGRLSVKNWNVYCTKLRKLMCLKWRTGETPPEYAAALLRA